MNTQTLTNFFNSTKKVLSRRSPEILTGVGIAGMIATTVMAVKATPKAERLLKQAKEENPEVEFTPVEVVKHTWKCYIPAAVTCVSSAMCLIGASSIHTRRNAALMAAYNLSKVTIDEYKEFKEKANEIIGEKKTKTIVDQISKDKIEKNPLSNNEVIIVPNGTSLCYDAFAGRYFKSDIDSIKKAVNELNRRMVCGDMYASLNEFYNEIGLGCVDSGDILGWNVDGGNLEVDFSAQIADNGDPCLVVHFNMPPQYNFDKMF